MLLLAADTATRGCSVAVFKEKTLLGEVTTVKAETHSRHLMSQIASTLRLAGYAVEDVEAFAVNRGPGSFTGLRIGISTVLGLAEAFSKPVCGVSGLDALAMQSAAETVCAMVDAMRDEVYACYYRTGDGGAEPQSHPVVAGPDRVVDQAPEGCRFVGSGAVRYADKIAARYGRGAVISVEACHVLRAETIARLALRQLMNGGASALELRPLYLRKSDAELYHQKKI
jgi:tRNA threonylcarbamoyladenosine biosynthesis protein TsaB